MKLFPFGFLLVALVVALSGVAQAITMSSGAFFVQDGCGQCDVVNTTSLPLKVSFNIYLEDGSVCSSDTYTIPAGQTYVEYCDERGDQHCQIKFNNGSVHATFMYLYDCSQVGAVLELH